MNYTRSVFLFIAFLFVLAGYSQSHDFRITVSNISINEGSVFITLYNSEETWLEKAFKELKIPSNKEKKTVSCEIPYGTYGIAIYQDIIQNDEPDMNFLGAPKEPVAFGNNYKPFMGEPKFSKSSVQFDENYKIQVLELD